MAAIQNAQALTAVAEVAWTCSVAGQEPHTCQPTLGLDIDNTALALNLAAAALGASISLG